MARELAQGDSRPIRGRSATPTPAPSDNSEKTIPEPEVSEMARKIGHYVRLMKHQRDWSLGMPSAPYRRLRSWMDSISPPARSAEFEAELEHITNAFKANVVRFYREHIEQDIDRTVADLRRRPKEKREEAIKLALQRLQSDESLPGDLDNLARRPFMVADMLPPMSSEATASNNPPQEEQDD